MHQVYENNTKIIVITYFVMSNIYNNKYHLAMASNCQYFQDIQVILKYAKCLFSLTTHLQQLSFLYFDLDTQIVYLSTGYLF